MGGAAHPRRTAEARDRRRAVDRVFRFRRCYAKIGDLGRAVDPATTAAHIEYIIAGDETYAPPELLERQLKIIALTTSLKPADLDLAVGILQLLARRAKSDRNA